jgi:hypothetical protein
LRKKVFKEPVTESMDLISLSGKLSGSALAVAAIIIGCWAIYHFGPRPEKVITRQAEANQPIDSPSPKRKSMPLTPGAEVFDALFKASTTPVASGRTGDPPAKYIESLETIYRRRGYQRIALEERAVDHQSLERRLNRMRGKLIWRTEAGGISTIVAWGEDADPNREIPQTATKKVEKQMYLTAVSPAEGGGSQWTTSRYLADASQLKTLHDQLQSGGDWPGQDPIEVPRPSGLRRLISVGDPGNRGGNNESGHSPMMMVVYESRLSAELLIEWYAREMPLAGWKTKAGEKIPGVLHFTKGHRSCLVWISSGTGGDATSVIISSRAT